MPDKVDVGGCRLFAETHGQAGRPWLVLSNCLAADHTMWEPQLEWLASRYQVLVYDARGHGASDVPQGPLELADLVDDIVALMDHYDIETAAFLGLSIGGMTGLGLALTYPERLSRIVCCCARSDAPPPFARGWEDRIARIATGGIASLLPETLDRWVSPEFRSAHPEEFAKLSAMFLRTSDAGYVACATALQKLAYRPHLGRIALPALFVAGENDAAAPAEAMRDMAGAVQGARFAIVPGARHLANVDRPAAFRDAIAGFLQV